MDTARPLPPPIRGIPALRWSWLAALAAVLAILAGVIHDGAGVPAADFDPATVKAGLGPRNYAAAVAEAERAVDGKRESNALRPGEWMREEQLAGALIARFRLTGDYGDLVEAERILDGALARTPDPAGPALTKAMLAVLTHRLDPADRALARVGRWVVAERAEIADAAALAGDAALQRGRLGEAAAAYARARRTAPNRGIDVREAALAAVRGQRVTARDDLERLLAEPRQTPLGLATLALQRANLAYAEGDRDGAGPWIAAANRLFPGYWLAEAYAAQQQALAGRTENAIRAYRALATRSGRPEVMDALAQLLRLKGRRGESLAWWHRADAIWRRRLAQVPEAAALHAVEHELVAGSLTRALEFAREDVARRPAGPGIALLARALILAGRPHEALAWLDRAERQGWVSAGHLMLRADAAATAGDEAASDAARNRAEAINPKAADPATRLVWFGHD